MTRHELPAHRGRVDLDALCCNEIKTALALHEMISTSCFRDKDMSYKKANKRRGNSFFLKCFIWHDFFERKQILYTGNHSVLNKAVIQLAPFRRAPGDVIVRVCDLAPESPYLKGPSASTAVGVQK